MSVLSVLRRVVLSPVLSAALLGLFWKQPSWLHNTVFERLGSLNISLDTVVAILKVHCVLGTLCAINGCLNSWALSNWRVAAHSGWDWPAEVAVVTGGSSGIGQKIVDGLSRKGTRVAILDIQPPLSPIKDSQTVTFYQCDITSPESVANAARAIRRDLGQPTILVNNAGIYALATIHDAAFEAVNKVFQVNCLSHWITTKEFLPHMVRNDKGHVVTVASLASFMALPNAATYSASKAAILAFHETLAAELRNFHKVSGVLTTVVHPDFVQTPLLVDVAEGLQKHGKKLLDVQDVADAILNQIFARRGGQVVVPKHSAFLTGFRGWPNWVQEAVRDGVGSRIAIMNGKA